MTDSTTGKRLDLSKLTDEEAKHVLDVVQRDFDLRKKEEDRLGELKTKIEREDIKRELLGHRSSLAESYCIRCLHPFKFLVNSKRQCLDCHSYVCKSCCRYNKKEQGSVCDSCHMARVLKIGTLEWYHENVRARFKRFGSAKVMQSLFKRLTGEHSCSQSDYGGVYEEHCMDATDSQHYKEMKKAKRRLTVDPIDFNPGWHYTESRGGSCQPQDSHDIMIAGAAERESMLADADTASVFHQISQEQHTDDLVYSDNPTVPSRSVSQLSHSSRGSGSAGATRGSGSYLPGLDDSEEEDDDRCQRYLFYHSHLSPSNHTSQESLNSNANPQPQIANLDRNISTVETFLNSIERKVTSIYDEDSSTPNSDSPLPQSEDMDLEEQQLRQKLREMTNNISDHSLSSDDDEPQRPHSSHEIKVWRSHDRDVRPSRIPTRPTSRTGMVDFREQPQQNDSRKMNHTTKNVERKLHHLEEGSVSSFRGSTALLVELEDQVAQAAANVQNAQSQVSYIENRIAALNASGVPVDRRRRSAIPIQPRRLSHSITTSQADRFVRNSLNRGSLTQRNPMIKPKPSATCAKPLMTQGS